MKWMISEEKLGPDQREVINDLSKGWKNTWIKGHAGSGKSVLLIHLLRDYLANNPKAKVCAVVFTRSLIDMISTGIKELEIERIYNCKIPVLTIYEFAKVPDRFDVIFCDEVQDIPATILHDLKTRAKTVIVAGDEAQSIYTKVPEFNEEPATSQQIKTILEVSEKPLHYIYRMTRSVVALLSKVFTSLLSGRPNVERNDVDIRFCKANSLQSELEYVWQECVKVNKLRADEVVAVLIPNTYLIINFANFVLSSKGIDQWQVVHNNFGNPDFNDLNNYLSSNSIPLMYVGKGYGLLSDADRDNKIILMTYHSAKGLDFDHVFLPMLGENVKLPADKARTLMFVALTRSKFNLMVSYSGNLYPMMALFFQGKTPFAIERTSQVAPTGKIII